MLFSFLAAALVAVHFAFTAFVVFGGFFTWRWRWMAFVHLPALAWGLWIEVSHDICPLTPLETHLHQLAGEAGYRGGFLEHYLGAILYPLSLTPHIQWMLAGLLVALNLLAYAWLVRQRRRTNT
jgi:hypothetical protein